MGLLFFLLSALLLSTAWGKNKDKKPKKPGFLKGVFQALHVCDAIEDRPMQECMAAFFAGQHIEIGEVVVELVEGQLQLTYEIDNLWRGTLFHYYLGSQRPTKHAPGQFPFGSPENVFLQTYSGVLHDVQDIVNGDECFYVAAHADVETSYIDEFGMNLPDNATIILDRDDPLTSYWNVNITEPDSLDGYYENYCIDLENSIQSDTEYQVDVISSYDTEQVYEGLVVYPGNFSSVNWILNERLVGENSPGCTDLYTYGDVQRAIWVLLEGILVNPEAFGSGPSSNCRVNKILEGANQNQDYVPPCDDDSIIAVILDPESTPQITIAQITIASVVVDLDCEKQEESAWADGDCDFEQGWGSYFKCCLHGDE